MLDLLITHALYPDFEAGEMKRGSIGIRDGRIPNCIYVDEFDMVAEALKKRNMMK